MRHFHVKKDDEVVVIAGRAWASAAKSSASPARKDRAVVEGLHMIKRHTKKNQAHPQGAIVEREGTIHISNLMLAEKFDARAAARAARTASAPPSASSVSSVPSTAPEA